MRRSGAGSIALPPAWRGSRCYRPAVQCNIDRRGRSVRYVIGGASLLAGVLLSGLVLGGVIEPRWLLWVAVGAIVGGGFGLFEASKGWCALRAMGFRTPV